MQVKDEQSCDAQLEQHIRLIANWRIQLHTQLVFAP